MRPFATPSAFLAVVSGEPSAPYSGSQAYPGVLLKIWLKQGTAGKEKKTAGKDFRESALTPVATKFDKKVRKFEEKDPGLTKKC